MRLRELGERRILEEIIFKYLSNQELIDEDAVPIKLNDKYLVVNIDTFVKSTDAPEGMPYRSMGWKIVTMTLSDIIAKGATPTVFLCSISAPADMDSGDLEEVVSGIANACKYYECEYLGGDLGGARELIITGIGIGEARRFIRRGGAKVGDTVWVTGPFSRSAVALHFLLEHGKPIKNMEKIINEYFQPKIRRELAIALTEVANACIDSSDGLAISLNELAKSSGVRIELDKIPIADEVREYARFNGIDEVPLALYCGEEFEIIFTTDKSDRHVEEVFECLGLNKPIKIGRVVEGKGVYFGKTRIPRKGWEHFRRG